MVDETQPDFLQIDEDEDSGVSNFTAFDLLQQPSKFKEELEKQYKVEDDLVEQSTQNYIDQFGRLANYPKTIDLGDPTGVGIFRTPEEREETSVSLSPAYKAGADFFYKIGNKFPDIIDNNKYAQLFGSLKGASGTAKFLWKDLHEIFGKMEMGKDITAMEGATALVSLADFSFVGGAFMKAPQALPTVSNYLRKLGVPEKEVTTKALKVITDNPQHIDEYAGAVDITELSDEAYDKLNLNAAVPPRESLTAKDEILGLGDDVVPPKNIQETPTLKQEPSPAKSTEVEGPVTIDDILETTRKDLAGREAFEGMSPRDIIKKGEEPKDPFLTPDEPISAPKQEKQTVAKDPVVVDLKTKIPEFTNLSDAEKQLVAQRFAQYMLNPAKRTDLPKSLLTSEIAEVERYALEKGLITKETVNVIKQSQKNQPGGDEISRLAKVEDQKLFDDFETELSTGNFNSNDPQQVRLAFANAFTGGARKTKFTGVDPLSKDKNYLRALSRKIIDYNKNKGFGPFNASKGFEKGRVYNRDQLQQINRFLKVGEDSLEKSSVSNKFENYLTGNNVYNDLKNTMQPLDDSFYPIVDGKIDRDFTKKLKRYLNFVRETSAKTKDPVKGSFDPFMKEFDLDIKALADPNSIEYKNFQKFAYYDKIRE